MCRFVETQNLASQGWHFGGASRSETQDFASLLELLRQNRTKNRGHQLRHDLPPDEIAIIKK